MHRFGALFRVRQPGAVLLLASVLMGAGHGGQAQQPAAANPTNADAASPKPAADAGTPATVIDDKQIESILGKSVLSPTGEDMGRIIDVLVDKKGKLRAAVVDFGGFFGVGSRKIAVDWHSLHFQANEKGDTIVAELPQKQLSMAPVYKEGEPVVVLGRAVPTDTAEPPPATPSAPETAPK